MPDVTTTLSVKASVSCPNWMSAMLVVDTSMQEPSSKLAEGLKLGAAALVQPPVPTVMVATMPKAA